MNFLRRLFRREITVRMVRIPSDEEGASIQLEMVADWLEDRARLLGKLEGNTEPALELAICADAVRHRQMLPGGIIAHPMQPYPTNGGERIG